MKNDENYNWNEQKPNKQKVPERKDSQRFGKVSALSEVAAVYRGKNVWAMSVGFR